MNELLNKITEQSIIDAVQKMSAQDNITYDDASFAKDTMDAIQVFITPSGNALNATEHGGHYSFIEAVLSHIEGLSNYDKYTEGLYDYIVQELGFITLNSGYGTSDYCRAIVWNRPTKEQAQKLKLWFYDVIDLDEEEILVVTKDGEKFFEEGDYNFTPSRIVKALQKSFISKGFLESRGTSNMNELTNIKDWYLNEFPDDELGNELNDEATFLGLFETLDARKNVYTYLFGDPMGGDSLIRERVFEKLAEIMEVPYEEVYEQWLLTEDDEDIEVPLPEEAYEHNEDSPLEDGRIVSHIDLPQEDTFNILKLLYNKSALTFEGLDINSVPEALEFFASKGAENAEANIFSGEQFNEIFRLSGRNAYPEDLTIVVFENTGTIIALTVGARWLDDIVDNNADREGYHPFHDGYWGNDDDYE